MDNFNDLLMTNIRVIDSHNLENKDNHLRVRCIELLQKLDESLVSKIYGLNNKDLKIFIDERQQFVDSIYNMLKD